ncbi:hypothetical protein BH20ACI3_BH20ACI3_33230 [soil metagenome]
MVNLKLWAYTGVTLKALANVSGHSIAAIASLTTQLTEH